VREAAPEPWRADERPHHQIAPDLGRVIPATHPDREHLGPILKAGAALTHDQKFLVDALASKHAAALQALNAQPDLDADKQVGLPDTTGWDDLSESAFGDGGRAALEAAGFRLGA
jgi:hypothetical protein